MFALGTRFSKWCDDGNPSAPPGMPALAATSERKAAHIPGGLLTPSRGGTRRCCPVHDHSVAGGLCWWSALDPVCAGR